MSDFYSVETVGHGGCLVCDDEHVDTKPEAWAEARRQMALYPEYSTLVYRGRYLTDEEYSPRSYTFLWASRGHPDDNASLPRSPRDDEYEG